MTKTELESFSGVSVLRRSATEERSAQDIVMEAASVFTPRMEIQPARGSALDVVLDMIGTSRISGRGIGSSGEENLPKSREAQDPAPFGRIGECPVIC